MNTNGLTKYYDCLTPCERLPLIVSASARGEDGECERLAGSAPKLCFRVPNYWGLAEGLDDLAKLYVLEQLDLVAIYWQVTAILEQESLFLDKKRIQERKERIWKATQTLAYGFVVRADGWKLLGAELHIDPDVLLRELPGYERIRAMEEVARLIACTPEQAIANLREAAERDNPAQGEAAPRREYRIQTAEDVARSMRNLLDEKLDAWS